jgi:phosphoglycerate dehydrogenase-like enzyme
MHAERPKVVVSFGSADIVAGVVGHVAEVSSLRGLKGDERRRVLSGADVLLCWNWPREITADDATALRARFVQLVSAGADHFPFDQLPPGALLASNVGAYAEPMAEHVLAMALALLKQLPQRHRELAAGVWDQSPTRSLSGTVCGILGFGGIGQATARRMRALGARIHAVNTSGSTLEPVEFVGTLDDLDAVLGACDVLVVSLPLTRRTRGLLARPQLERMKADAVLVNVARGAVVDQADLYAHLQSHPEFSAAIDAWWTEPFHAGQFRVEFPFFELPNVLGSPHNSALVPGIVEEAIGRAAANVGRFLAGEPVTGEVRRDQYAEP